MEKDMLGVYLTDHPLNHIREIFLAQVKTSSSSLADKKDGAPVTIGGIISKARKILTRQQKTMFTAVLEDFKGHTPIVVFPNTYEKYSACLTDDAVVIVEGKVNRREEEVKIIAERISLLSERPQKTVSLHIEITDQNNNEVIEKLKKTLIYYKGQTPVYLHTEESVIATSQDFWINLNPAVIAQLEELVGTGRVWTV
jgi:DNA polymerase-3 subunit alpha